MSTPLWLPQVPIGGRVPLPNPLRSDHAQHRPNHPQPHRDRQMARSSAAS